MKVPEKYSEKQLVTGFLLFSLFLGLILIFTTENSFGGGDHFTHFKLARWSWKYPHLLFNHWGKPLFTILISPFAQLGINYARIFNLLVGLSTAWFSWQLSRELKLKNCWLTVLLVLLTPVYFSLIFSVMTEPLHSLFLVLAVWLFFKNRFAWSAVAISFLPIIRTESVVLIPIFLFAFGLRKQWKSIPLMVTGFVIISLAGWCFHNSFWWLITEMPYKGNAAGIYGHGSLFHFINSTKGILGFPIAGLFVIGLLVSLWLWIKKDRFKINNRFYYLLLVPGIYLTFMAAHSVVWWKGWGNSLGLIRVMGSVAPLAAITALTGFNFLEEKFSRYKKPFLYFEILMLMWMFAMIYSDCRGGFKKSKPQVVLSAATKYIQKNHLDKYKIYYFNNYIPYRLNIDPYDEQSSQWGVPNVIKVSFDMPDSSLIVWDAHFGNIEGQTPLKKLLSDDNLKLIKIFKPEKPFVEMGYSYEVYLFQKVSGVGDDNNNLFLNFEQDNPEFSAEKAYKGNKSYKVLANHTFTNLITSKISDFCTDSCKITISGAIYTNSNLKIKSVAFVISRESEQSPYFFKPFDLSEIAKPGKWVPFKFQLKLKPPANNNEIIKAYIWNKGHETFWIDEVRIQIK